MKIDIDLSMSYRLGSERLALLAVEVVTTDNQRVLTERLDINGAVLRRIDGEDGFGQRTWARISQDLLTLDYRAEVEVSRSPVHLDGLAATPLDELPDAHIAFLRPSRFCQSDQFETFVANEFGPLSGGARIAAIVDWIAEEMDYAPGGSDGATTLLDTFASRKGVCRDFAHMLCGLARASHIPARYVAAYGASVDPPDFHAVVEVFLDGKWQLVDPTGMCGADELALIAIGRDAADVPFMETPDEAGFVQQRVQVTRR